MKKYMAQKTSEEKSVQAEMGGTGVLYRGRHFSFEVRDITLPNTRRARMAMIRHPGSTGIVPLLPDGSVVMLRQYRPIVGCSLLEIPAGTLEPGETPEACAARELAEEAGLAAGRFTALGRIHILPAYSDEVIHLFLARDLTPVARHPDEDEIIETTTIPLSELMKAIETGGITDALTVLALQRLAVQKALTCNS